MPATVAKYEDMRQVSGVFVAGETYKVVTIQHNLAKQHPDGVNFDYVNPELVDVDITDGYSNGNTVFLLNISHPPSANGYVIVILGIEHALGQGETRAFQARVNCIYGHSIGE